MSTGNGVPAEATLQSLVVHQCVNVEAFREWQQRNPNPTQVEIEDVLERWFIPRPDLDPKDLQEEEG